MLSRTVPGIHDPITSPITSLELVCLGVLLVAPGLWRRLIKFNVNTSRSFLYVLRGDTIRTELITWPSARWPPWAKHVTKEAGESEKMGS